MKYQIKRGWHSEWWDIGIDLYRQTQALAEHIPAYLLLDSQLRAFDAGNVQGRVTDSVQDDRFRPSVTTSIPKSTPMDIMKLGRGGHNDTR